MPVFTFARAVPHALLLAVMASSVAHAGSGEASARTVSYADLNLAAPNGVAALYQRVYYAASNVCAPLDGRELGRHIRFRQCVDAAVAKAVSDVGQEPLTTYHAVKTQGKPAAAVRTASR